MYQLWWVIGGVLESLQNGGLETSVALKRLLGQADRQLKYVIDEGLLAYEKHPIDDLLNNLLYYVARSSTRASASVRFERHSTWRNCCRATNRSSSAREALSAPSAKLMETVGSAIRRTWSGQGRARYLRSHGHEQVVGACAAARTAEKDQRHARCAGTRRTARRYRRRDRSPQICCRTGGVANDQIILDIASTLLRVEDRLEQQLIRLTMPARTEAEEAPEDDEEFRKVAESVMRECIINLARIKETISQSIAAQAPSHGLDSVPSLIRGIKAGLLMLEQDARHGGGGPRRQPGYSNAERRRAARADAKGNRPARRCHCQH